MKFINDDGLVICGNITFCLLLAIFPFLLFFTSLTVLLTGDNNAQTAIDYLFSIAPENIINPIAKEIKSLVTASDSNLITLSAFLTFWTGVSAVEAVRGALNKAYIATEDRPYWLRLIQDTAFILIGIISIISLGAMILFTPKIVSLLHDYFPSFTDLIGQFNFWSYPIGILLLTLIIFATNAIIPNKRPTVLELLPGVIFSVITWLILVEVFAIYLNNFSKYAAIYGSLAGIIATMVFIYFSAIVFMLGSEINQTSHKLLKNSIK